LNDLERRNSPYFAFFTEFDRVEHRPQMHFMNWITLQADYVTVVEDRHVLVTEKKTE